MDLIIKPTEECNFKCTFCSSTEISESNKDVLSLDDIFRFVDRFPDLRTIIVNGGDPLMMPPGYYQDILDYLDNVGSNASLSLTTNLWAFYKNPDKWLPVFKNPRVGVMTSFQYGDKRLKGDLTPFTEEEFWSVSDMMLDKVGYRPSFIAVVDEDNIDDAIRTVELARDMNVECKLNYLMASGKQKVFKTVIMGSQDHQLMLPFIYRLYLEIYSKGLMEWEYNTKQMAGILSGSSTSCPLNRKCDEGIRALQPSGRYYSCGSFGDDNEHPIDFEAEMAGGFERPLQKSELLSLKESCFTCPLFKICNGCKKTISDTKRLGNVEKHCRGMKELAADIIQANGMEGVLSPTPYVDESRLNDNIIPATQIG